MSRSRERGGVTPIAVFLSGGGRTLKNLVVAIDAGELDAEVVLVVANRPCDGLTWARERGFECVEAASFEDAGFVAGLLEGAGAEYAVLAGFLKRLAIPEAYRGRVINIHPALLPRFGGPRMYGMRVHRAVLEAGESESGCTVHYADDEYDTGEHIAQARCAVEAGDTPETLAERVFALECALFPRALQGVFTGRAVADR